MGVRRVIVFCADHKCSHSVLLNADRWADNVRLSDVEGQFVCKGCGKRDADVRPDFPKGKRIIATPRAPGRSGWRGRSFQAAGILPGGHDHQKEIFC